MEAVEHLQVGDIVGMIVFFAGAITSGKIVTGFFTKKVETIVEDIVKKQVANFEPRAEQFKKDLAATNEKIDRALEAIHRVDVDNAKNYLQQIISAVDNGLKLDDATRIRFSEVLDHYSNDLHLNSWVHDAIERLKKEGKL